MKHVVVTGTSRGIGFEMVKILSKQGHKVVALSRNTAPIEDLKLKGVAAIACDLTREEDLQKVKEYIANHLKSVDILINNAGAIINKPFSQTTPEDFQKVYATNVYAVVSLIQYLLPLMNSAGHVVNISSMGGVQGSMKFGGLSAYSSSKGALITLTEMLAEEYKEQGPSFNVLALGAVQTEMLEEAFPGYKAPLQAEEMADYVVNFSLTANKFYNGKLLQVSNSTP